MIKLTSTYVVRGKNNYYLLRCSYPEEHISYTVHDKKEALLLAEILKISLQSASC